MGLLNKTMSKYSEPGDKPVRTIPQNSAIHKYYDMLADSLNNAGYDVRAAMRHDAEIPWTRNLVKELIWRKVQLAMFDIESTTKLDTTQVSEIYEVINRHTAQTFAVSVAFPSKDKQLPNKNWKKK
jgi:hypothetical protein